MPSFLYLIPKQLVSNAEQFGYKGEPSEVDKWAAEQALQVARTEGLVRTGSDTRLTTESIGRLAVLATHKGDGIGVSFVDTASGHALTLDQIHDPSLHLTYEYGGLGSGGAGSELPIETHGAVGVDRLAVGGAHVVDFDYSADGETVTGLSIETNWVDPMEKIEDFKQIEAMTGGLESLIGALQQDALERQGEIETVARRLVGWTHTLERMNREGLGQTAEAMVIRQAAQADLNYVESYSQSFGAVSSDSDVVRTLTEQVNLLDTSIIENPDLDGLPPVESLHVPGLGELSFSHDAAGRPNFDLEQLVKNAKPGIAREAERLLTDGWKDRVDTEFLSRAELYQASATKVFMMEKALRVLEAQGHGNSGEALYLKESLWRELQIYGDLFDKKSEVVRQALADAKIIVAPESLPPATENMGDLVEAAPQPGLVVGEESTPLDTVETPPPGTSEQVHKFENDGKKIRFFYTKDGDIKKARIPLFFATRAEMGEAVKHWGVTREQIFEAFRHKGYATNWGTEGREVMRQMVLAQEKQAVLEEMKREGLENTPEYAYLERHVKGSQEYATRMLNRVLPRAKFQS